MSTNELIMQHLSDKLKNRNCYTLADQLMGVKDAQVSNNDLLEALAKSPFVKMILSDKGFAQRFASKGYTVGQETTAAINELVSQIIEAPTPLAIGRSLVRVVETQRESIKVRKPTLGNARATSRGAVTTSKGLRNSYVTITVDQEIESSETWDLNFQEDSDWPVAAEETSEVMRAVTAKETSLIEAQLQAIADASLAGGAEVSCVSAGTLDWPDFCNLWGVVAQGDYVANRTAMNPRELSDVFKADEFTNSLMLGDFVDLSKGTFGRTVLGTDILASSLITQTDVFMLDANSVLMYAIRRDRLLSSWESQKDKEFGVQCSTRYGFGYGRKDGCARMDNA